MVLRLRKKKDDVFEKLEQLKDNITKNTTPAPPPSKAPKVEIKAPMPKQENLPSFDFSNDDENSLEYVSELVKQKCNEKYQDIYSEFHTKFNYDKKELETIDKHIKEIIEMGKMLKKLYKLLKDRQRILQMNINNVHRFLNHGGGFQ